jgi:hypothetical protein
MAEATIDELQIEIEADGADAAQSLEKLQQALERLVSPVQALTTGNGLNKLTKQLQKLAEAGRAISGLSGLDKITQAANALKSLDMLTGAPKVNSYVNALNKLANAGSAVQTIAAFPDITAQLTALTNALSGLRNVQDIRLTGLTNSLRQLPAAVQAINSMPAVDVSRVEALNTAMSAFRTGNAQAIRQLANALNRLPTVAQRINQIDFTQFSNSIRQLTTTLEPLMRRAEQAAQGLSALAQIMQATSRQSNNSGGLGGLGRTLGSLSTKTLISWGSLLKLKKVLGDCFNISAQYVENLNLFNVTMGKSASTAFEFAEAVNAALGIDTSDWIRYQGFFQSVGKGFGVVSDKADLMSKNLTQLSYDISSFYNISTEEAYNKVQSGFAGELEPLRRLGFALDEATLKQLAYKKGITQTYESMTQAQKAQLRYVAMIEQAQNIGVTGDMSRTIDTASNGVRVLEARIQQFARAIGNMLMPMLSAILPYLTAFVQVLTEGANELANMFGFELPKIDLSGVSNGYDDIADAADGATAATEKFKGSLAGVDQLNIIGSHTDKNGTGTGYSTDLDIELPTYDFLNGVESKTKEIAENIKKWFQEALPWIEAVGAGIAGAFAPTVIAVALGKVGSFVSKIISLVKWFKQLKGFAKVFYGLSGGLAAGATSGVLLYNSIKNLIKGTGDLSANFTQLAVGIGIAVVAFAAFVAFSNPVGAIITVVLALTGAVMGVSSAIDELNAEMADTIMYADNGGISVDEFSKCFSGLFDNVSARYQDIIATSDAIKENQEKASGAAEEILNLTDKYQELGKAMTPEDAEKIKDNLDIIGSGIKQNLGYYTQTLVDNLKTSFHDLAVQMGDDVDDMVLKWYTLENMGNSALANLRKDADELSAKIFSGDASDEDYAKFNETVRKMATVDTHTSEQESLNRAFANITNGSIDLEDESQVTDAINDLLTSADTAAATIREAWDRQSADLKNYRDTLVNWGVDTEYDEKYGKGKFDELFADQKTLIDAGYQQELEKIELTKGAGIGAIWDQVDSRVQEIFENQAPNLRDYWVVNSNALVGKDILSGAAFSANYWNGSYGSAKARERKEADKDNRIADIKNGQFKGIYDALGAAGIEADEEKYKRYGSYITQGIANGIVTDTDTLEKAMNILATSGEEAFKEALQIHSPSKVFEELGGYVTQGLALGISDGEADVDEAVDNIAAGMASRMPYGKNDTGYAWSGAKEMYANSQPSDNSVTVGDTNVTVEIDGEELANYVVRAQGRQVVMSNGR